MGNYGGVSAINGVFFCPSDYGECRGKNSTINERFIQWEEIATYKSTGERVVFGWNKDIEPFLHQTDKINIEKRSDIYEGFANFPLLLQSGENQLEYYYDIGLIDYKMRSKLTRHFICSNEPQTHIYFWRVTEANLDDMVWAISKIGCYDAINLDAGRSSSFIYNGRNLSGPGRDILDGVIISRNDINIQEINTSIEKVFIEIEKQFLKRRNTDESLEQLQKYRETITSVRRTLYKKHSQDITNSGSENIWYTLHVENSTIFRKIYILNSIDNKIKELIGKIHSLKS